MNVTIGVKVRIKGKEEYGIGVIEHIEERNIFGKQTCIVGFSDRKVKVMADDIELILENVTDPDTITISREEFDKAVLKVCDPEMYKDDIGDINHVLALSLSGMLICSKLKRELFDEK